MKLKISNLGPIDSMVIDMSKPFILFAGDNSTGKTYATTYLYTLIRFLSAFYYGSQKLSIGKSYENIIEGDLDELIGLLIEHDQKLKLEKLAEIKE